MFFSCLLATLNRPKEIKECLKSLFDQNYIEFEILIIDQSENSETQLAISQLQCTNNTIQVNYQRVTGFKSLSKARNHGINLCHGDYICLIDDDAVYDKNYLSNAFKMLRRTPNVILSGIIRKIETGDNFVDYSSTTDLEEVGRQQIAYVCLSAGLIIPKNLLKLIKGFDEQFGIGSKFGAGEETDVLLLGRRLGYLTIHMKSMVLYHPTAIKFNDLYYQKIFNYYTGFGALVKKHLIYRHDISLLKRAIRIGIGSFLKVLLGNKKVKTEYMQRIKGFYYGLMQYKE